MTFDERVTKLNEMIAGARHIVFFTGAGISTGSGIPDFRSADGLYNTIGGVKTASPEYMLSYTCLQRHPKEFVQYMRDNMDFRKAEPNIAHLKISELQQARKVSVITQNIDGLHTDAGSKRVLELHGSIKRNYCMKCKKFYDEDYVLNSKDVPVCSCGGVIKPDVVLYEENLNDNILYNAIKDISNADCLIVGGTSLTVYPAAGLIHYFNGDNIILINKSKTDYDKYAKIVFNESISDVFSKIKI